MRKQNRSEDMPVSLEETSKAKADAANTAEGAYVVVFGNVHDRNKPTLIEPNRSKPTIQRKSIPKQDNKN